MSGVVDVFNKMASLELILKCSVASASAPVVFSSLSEYVCDIFSLHTIRVHFSRADPPFKEQRQTGEFIYLCICFNFQLYSNTTIF